MTHTFKNLSPWSSLFLILLGDVGLKPDHVSRSLTGCILSITSFINKSASFLEFADLIAITEAWLNDTEHGKTLCTKKELESLLHYLIYISKSSRHHIFPQNGLM